MISAVKAPDGSFRLKIQKYLQKSDSSISTDIPYDYIFLLNSSGLNSFSYFMGSRTSKSLGVTFSSIISSLLFNGFISNLVPLGKFYLPPTIQSLTNPPFIIQLY